MSRKRLSVIAASVLAVGAISAGAAFAGGSGGGSDAEDPITGSALKSAEAAALNHTGGGRVTETEVGDEESYYEVEVTLNDGSQVDVQLDKSFNVVSTSADVEDHDTQDGPADG